MKIAPGALVQHARTDSGRKQLRYAAVSLLFVPLGQVLIQLLGATVFTTTLANGLKETNWVAASVTSAAILTVPNFFANKYLVWKNTSRDNLRTQVLVFWVAAMLGVTFATALTFVVDAMIESHGWIEKVAVFFAQMTGFGIVWLGRYLILDRWLFKVTHHGEEPGEDDLEMMHGDLPV
jgi:putative flippase GtrA